MGIYALKLKLLNILIIILPMMLRSLILLVLLSLAVSNSEYFVYSSSNTSSSVTLDLDYFGTQGIYGNAKSPICRYLTFSLKVHTFNDFTVKIIDRWNERYEIPQGGVFPKDPFGDFSYPYASSAIKLEYNTKPFDFRIIRKANGAVLFSTYQSNFTFSEYYMEIGTSVASDYVYGIGERFMNSFKKADGKWTVFNRDRGQVIDTGVGLQTYGHYPIYMVKEKQNLFHLNYLRNSNAMDIIKQTVTGNTFLIYKVIGGVFDFRFFLGQAAPQLLLQKLHFYTGRSIVPPFWAMGFHQCRWGYKDANALQEVLSKYAANNIPLDTIWSDIDYMIDYQDFTIDQTKFPLDAMKDILSKKHYIPIIDAGIKTAGYAYTEGLSRNVFIRDSSGQVYKGKVWPGETAFVDFFHPNATQYWQDMLKRLYTKVKFSGVWLDMNELANFCDGACTPPAIPSKFDYSKDLPYQPGADSIQSHTISLNSTHYGNLKEADVHAFNALLETAATNAFLKSQNVRPFIISRSTSLGSNKYGFHWTGDNSATWDFLRNSIAQNFNNQMWGLQMVGPDICGFGGNTTEQLCARWYQLGALYPFARSHNAFDSISQQPYALGATVLKAAQVNIMTRYGLLKYYYSFIIQKKGLGTIFRPLFFLFPFDNNLYVNEVCDTQFIIGDFLMSAPILTQGQTTRNVYFPNNDWYDAYSGQKYSRGSFKITNLPTDQVPLFIPQGFAVLGSYLGSHITSTYDIDNQFVLVFAGKLDSKKSDSTHKYYEAVTNILSLKNYQDDSKIDLCLKESCQYVLTLQLLVTDNVRTLQIVAKYNGGQKLNQQVIISAIFVYYDDVVAKTALVNPVIINGPLNVTVPINDDAKNKVSFLTKQL